MVLHHSHPPILAALRKLGLVTAVAVSMVIATAVLMALMQGPGSRTLAGEDGQPTSAAELIMKSATERALVSPRTIVLAGNIESNEGRGF